MTENEKAKFAAQAEADKQRFEREMAAYQPGEKRKKKKKDPLAPKRPLYDKFEFLSKETSANNESCCFSDPDQHFFTTAKKNVRN